MAALTQKRPLEVEQFSSLSFPLAAGKTAYQGGMVCANTADGTVVPGAAGTTFIRIGSFAQNLDNSAGTASANVLVRLEREVTGTWFDNATGANKVLASDLFNDVYILDDHTVTKASSGNSKAGRVWAVNAVKGVLVSNSTPNGV